MRKSSSEDLGRRGGKFLRRTTLDELPQLIDVLKGEVSLVGPRPPIPSEVEKYRSWQRRRLSMKSRMTCDWQISGRSKISFDKWMEMDLAYIDNWSLWLDFCSAFDIGLQTFFPVKVVQGGIS